ncbi:hypothetical protein EUGRSUZ_G00849 [Eucalyptus grandis]|uniref:Uncharacterized protein n=2 Tax=Eucalyptus grandis TaxID=71139 RepID=A0ACC3K0Z4_EUCGR|nr:hypothetical protein EUGRSUZ_G00849 [Eucalyptus grandis]
MASHSLPLSLFFFLFILLSSSISSSTAALVQQQPLVLKYHNGALLKGNITVDLVWYGRFSPTQRSVIVDFIRSLGYARSPPPSAASWWRTTEKYRGGSSNLVVGRQALHEAYTLGKSLENRHLRALAGNFNAAPGSITVVLTAADVAVEAFCMRCGTHGSARPGSTFVWVGNSETQCPGQCAWPFHQPVYGPQTPPLVAPSGDVGADGMVINLATLLAGTRVLPGPGGGAAGGGVGVHRDIRVGRVLGLPGPAPGGQGDRRELQRQRARRSEVPVAGDVGPGDVRLQDPRVIAPRGRRRTSSSSSMYYGL